MEVTFKDIWEVLEEYDEPERTTWAQYLHEQYHEEAPHLRHIIFGNLVSKLIHRAKAQGKY